MLIKLTMLLIFFAVMVAIGLYCRKTASDVNGFVLGGRSVGPWLTAFAYGTSYFSAVVFVGYAGQFGWKYGIAATWAGIGNALLGSLLAWVVLGRRTRIMSQHLDSATMPEFFGKRFGSPSLKVAASVIIFIFLIPYTASLYNGLSRLFGMAFDIDYTVCVIVMAVLTGVYVIAGGYMATAINDFIQGIIMLTSLGTWGLPQMVQKFYAIKSEKSIDAGTVISTLFALVVAGGCYFLGGFGRLFADRMEVVNGVPVGGYDAVIPTMLSGLPDLLMAVVVILVLSAAFLAPFLYGLYWKKATRAACWTSFLFSTVVMTANIFFQASFPALLRSPINAGAFCMLAGLVLVPVVSLLTPQPDAALVEDAFSCYDRKVLVRQREALGDGEKAG